MRADPSTPRLTGSIVGLACSLLLASTVWAAIQVPPSQGPVTDTAGILSAKTRQQLIRLDLELTQKTGAQIAIVTVRSTGEEPIFDYAMAIAETYKPGAKDKDNGVVFLIATADRKFQILTAYGVEGALPDGFIGGLRDTVIRPAFRTGDYSGGILDASVIMAQRIATDNGVKLTGVPETSRRVGRPGGNRAVGMIVLFLWFAFMRFGTSGRALVAGALLGGAVGRRSHHGSFGGGFGGGGGGFGGFGGGGFGGGGGGGSW